MYKTTLKTEYKLTDSMIKRIGPPDRLVRNPHHKSGPPSSLYCKERVKRWIAKHKQDLERADERRKQVPEIKHCDLLPAIFVVNRAAKRHRDAAETHFNAGRHGLASTSKDLKDYLYSLKDKGIAHAYQLGIISPVQIHGRLCLYRGEGYCFHSTLVPKLLELPRAANDAPITVDAKPQGSKEPLQRDAIATLEALPEADEAAFERLIIPRKERRTNYREVICHACGQEGHIARDCPADDQLNCWDDDEARSFP